MSIKAQSVPSTWILIIPFDPSLLSSNQRLHWGTRSRRQQLARTIAEGVWVAAGKPRARGRVSLNITVRRARKLDDDRLVSGVTALRDALFARRRVKVPGSPAYFEPGLMTFDDSPRWLVMGTIEQETGPQWRKREEVVFTVQEV